MVLYAVSLLVSHFSAVWGLTTNYVIIFYLTHSGKTSLNGNFYVFSYHYLTMLIFNLKEIS